MGMWGSEKDVSMRWSLKGAREAATSRYRTQSRRTRAINVFGSREVRRR